MAGRCPRPAIARSVVVGDHEAAETEERHVDGRVLRVVEAEQTPLASEEPGLDEFVAMPGVATMT